MSEIKRSCIGNILRDISYESKLDRAEKESLRQIAKDYDNLQAGNKQLKDILRYFYELPSKGVRNQAAHNKKLEEIKEALKGGGQIDKGLDGDESEHGLDGAALYLAEIDRLKETLKNYGSCPQRLEKKA